MRAGTLQCPTCGGTKLQDRSGTSIPWLVTKEPGTRRVLSLLALYVGGALALGGLALIVAGVGLLLDEGGVYWLVMGVLGGLIVLSWGLGFVRSGLHGLRDDPRDLVCTSCQTTWSLGAGPVTAAPQPPTAAPQPPTAAPQPRAPTPAVPAPTPVPAATRPAAATTPPAAPGTTVVPEPTYDLGTGPLRGVAALEDYLRSTLEHPTTGDAAELERSRIEAVEAIARTGLNERVSGRGDGHEAVQSLIRLLDVDTGHVPEIAVGAVAGSMRHHVIESLGKFGDPTAVEPLSRVLLEELEQNEAAAREFSGTGSKSAPDSDGHPLRRSRLAEDLFITTATVLAQLGDERALPALREAQSRAMFGMKKATKKAIAAIESR